MHFGAAPCAWVVRSEKGGKLTNDCRIAEERFEKEYEEIVKMSAGVSPSSISTSFFQKERLEIRH